LQWVVYDDWHDRSDHPIPIRPLATLTDDIPVEFGRAVEEEAVRETGPDDLATILYTSGTTGEPKGVMLSHENLVSNATTTCQAYGGGPDNRRLGILPLSHIYARTCDLYAWITLGSQFALAEDRESVLKNCAQVRPTDMNAVPYFYDKVCRLLASRGDADQPGALRRLLGGNIQFCCSGGAALPDSVATTFQRHGVPLLQGYGLTETSPVISFSSLDACQVGSVGRPLPGVEVRIAEDGEILTRGPHVMLGYWKDDLATAETIRDGWLRTGDLGALDDEGYLTIRGRKKEILVTSTGKNIVPNHLEGLLTASPLIAQAMVVGDARNFLTALIVPDTDVLKPILRERQLESLGVEQAIRQIEIVELFRDEIDARLASVSRFEQIGSFDILDRAFSQELGEMTAKLSLRRHVIEEHFHDAIERMYRSPS
ncbi:MAG: long-chain fatty acid--CoA ligase, partial [Pirellulales bacterium]